MNDRPIWRPNCFSPEQWQSLSREEQIHWWTEKNGGQQAEDGARSPNRATDLYARGVITKKDVPLYVFERITVENVKSFFVFTPQEIRELVIDAASQLPPDGDEKGWNDLRQLSGRSYAPWVSNAEVMSADEAQHRQLREGVRIFRDAMKSFRI